jgi:hypothetical protein
LDVGFAEVIMLDNDRTHRKPNPTPPDFPLFDEGSFFGLEKSAPRRWFERLTLRQRILMLVSVTWIPMAMLATMQGVGVGPTQPRSFLEDVGIYTRFFFALPMLLVTPSLLRERFERIVQHFMNSGLLKESDQERFLAIISSTVRLRYSRLADWICVAIAFMWSAAFILVPQFASVISSTWRSFGSPGHVRLSSAEWYFALVSEPIYVFVVTHFLYRVCLWWRTLWMISRLELQLRGAHPDGAGGLMFLSHSLPECRFPVFGLAAGLAGGFANVVLATGVSVLNFKYVILAIAVLLTATFAGPLCFFNEQLRRTRFLASLSHDRTELEQLRQFEQKWVGKPTETNLLEAPDFSAVIDLNSTVNVVHQMARFPISGSDLVELIVAALLPFLPVVALQIPVEELLHTFKELL